MTRRHAHRWMLGNPESREIEGRCACGQVRTFPATASTDYQGRVVSQSTKAQTEESQALMAHARSLTAEPR